jgi:glycerophosphoryl diester phosphodiesterase
MITGSCNTVLTIAHRGARAYAPENTLAAFAKAKTLGCQMVELDVRLSKDHKTIIHHDEQLTRCTDVANKFPGRDSYKAADFTAAEIARLDAGSWYIEQLALAPQQRQPFLQSLTDAEMAEFVSPSDRTLYASGTVQIPSLYQVLQLAQELGLMVNIELKTQPDTDAILATSVLKTIHALNMETRILISSFEHGLLRQVRRQSKTIATAVLSEIPLKAPVTYLRKLKVTAYNLQRYQDYKINGYGSLAGKRYLAHLAKIRHAGFAVNLWTCNDRNEIKALLATGVTGLISDYPNRVQAIISGQQET